MFISVRDHMAGEPSLCPNHLWLLPSPTNSHAGPWTCACSPGRSSRLHITLRASVSGHLLWARHGQAQALSKSYSEQPHPYLSSVPLGSQAGTSVRERSCRCPSSISKTGRAEELKGWQSPWQEALASQLRAFFFLFLTPDRCSNCQKGILLI